MFSMLRATLVLVGATAFATAAFAATFAEMDVNGDGGISADEFVAAYPDQDSNTFIAADANGDGLLSTEEHEQAVSSGILPAG